MKARAYRTKLIRLLGIAGLAFGAGLAAAGTIGTTTIDPATAATGAAATATVTAEITDPAVIPGSVQLQSLDSNGRVTSIVGTLHDDGLNGDATSNDGTFTFVTSIFQSTPGTLTFRVAAGFRGSLIRGFSNPLTFAVTGENVNVRILTPSNLLYTSTSPLNVTGTVGDPAATVKVNGVNAPVTAGAFQASIPLVEGLNTLTAVATSAGGFVSTSTAQVTLDTTPPHITIDSPLDGSTTTESTISVSGTANDIVVGTVNAGDVSVTINNTTAAQVANRTFSAANIGLNPGVNTIQAAGRDRAGNGVTVTSTVTRIVPQQGGGGVGAPVVTGSLGIVSGNNQSGTIKTVLGAPLVVALKDQAGNAIAGEKVVFAVTGNNGFVSAGQAGTSSVVATTDGSGKAQATWTLGERSGAGINSVQASSALAIGPVTFTATAASSGVSQIVVDSGNNQTGVVGQPLAFPFVAVTTDAGYNRVPNVPVTFVVKQGGGTLGGTISQTVTSDSNGRAILVLTVGPQPGNDSNVVEASFPGNTGKAASFIASAKTPGNPADTVVSGVVLDTSNNPIKDVTMRLYQTNQANNNNQPLQIGAAVKTDATGAFTMTSAPVGYFKLMADGSTATNGKSYPTLEFDIVTVAGQNNTLGTPIYLPVLDTVNQVCVDATHGGTLTLPQSPGFALKILPGSATFPGGSKTGCVSVTPVNPDKVPMAPGFGQQPRYIVTIQPVGTTFNPPAPITLPNLEGLAPKAVTEMYSYDHDLSMFVAIGTGTVSGDGSAIVSNPGVGVLKAGWHCGGNPNAAGSGEPVHVSITTPAPVTVGTGGTVNVSANGGPGQGSYKWTTSNPAVAEINGNSTGANVTVKGVSNGIAVLTVTYKCESGEIATASINVRVTSITITSLSPTPPTVGTDETISYKITGGAFDTVAVEIRNSAGTLVFKQSGLDVTPGTHSTVWPLLKWNQAPNAGAYVNPKNGPYAVKVIGTKGVVTETDTKNASPKLILEADIKDEKPAGSTVSRTAGLEDMISALKIVMNLGGAETVISGAGGITVTGAADAKHVKVDTAALNGLASGLYEVLFRDLRDDIGNFTDLDDNPANGIQPVKFSVNLR